MMIRTLIADDFPLLVDGVAHALDADPEIEVVGRAHNGEDALALARELRPDVLMLDLRMPGLGGLAVLDRLREDLPEVRTLVLTASERPERMLDAMALGARGYLTKRAPCEHIRQAVITVHGGGVAICPSLAGYMLRACTGDGDGRDALTAREREVLRMVAQGHTDNEIAAKLYLSRRTVQNQLTSIRGKSGVHRRAELARWASENAWV